ncbi:MAG: hypothetical protein Kow0029_13620 [Candidatus Rifleibacteriota bacterium]
MISSIGSRTLILAIMVFLTIICLFASVKLPVLGAIVLSFAGLPAFLIILAWGGIWFLIYSAITVILAGLVGNISLAALLIPMLFVPAAVLSGNIKMGFSPLKAMGVTLFAATAFSTASWFVATGMDDKEILQIEKQFSLQYSSIEKQLEKLQKDGEATPETVEIMRESVRETFDFLKLLVPVTFIFIWHLLSLAIFYAGAYKFAPKLGYRLQQFPGFASWRFDWNFIWLFLVGWFFYYVVSGIEGIPAAGAIKAIGANLLAISKIIYFLAGLSLLYFMFEKYQLGPLTRVGLSCLALVLSQAVVWLGIIDIWADFRTPKPALFTSDDSDGDF